METGGLLNGLLKCDEHDCPMVRIGDGYECVIERVDTHLGGKRVKDIVPGSQRTPVALVFEDGHTLPLLCPDCGDSLHIAPEEEDEFLDEAAGLFLVGVAYVEADQDPECLALVFTEDPEADPDDPDTPLAEVLLHLDSAQRLTCPGENRPRRGRRRPRQVR